MKAAAAAGHVFLQNEWFVTYGDRPYRAEANLQFEPIGVRSLYQLQSVKAGKNGNIEGKLEKTEEYQFEVYRDWLHLVRRRHASNAEIIHAAWEALAPYSTVSALDEGHFPKDPEGKWSEYSFVRQFPCQTKEPEVIALSAHFHPAHRDMHLRFSLWRRFGNPPRSASNMRNILENVIEEAGPISWEQAAELARSLAGAPREEEPGIVREFKERITRACCLRIRYENGLCGPRRSVRPTATRMRPTPGRFPGRQAFCPPKGSTP